MSEENGEEAEKAAFVMHGIRWAFPAGSLSPSATKLKSAMPGQIAKLKTIAGVNEWLEQQKELVKQGQADPKQLGMLPALTKYIKIRTAHYCDLIVSEDGYARNQLTQWVISQKSGQAMTIKKPGRVSRLFGKKEETKYVPANQE